MLTLSHRLKLILCPLLLLALNSCMIHHLEVQTLHLSKESLASYHVTTPDPQLDHPIVGERLFIQWNFKANEVKGLPLALHLSIRFRNHTQKELVIPIESCRQFFVGGSYYFEVTDEEYNDTGGTLTYLVEIKSNDVVVASWIHPLWVDLIQFDK